MLSTVLIVDDDPVQCVLLERIVARLGYIAKIAESGEQAMAILTGRDAQSIDLVLLDLVMPDLDGMAVLNRLRSSGSRLPVIALVTPAGVDGVMAAISAGASDFAVKPVGAERLQVSLMNALRFKALAAGVESDHQLMSDELTLEALAASDPGMARITELGRKALKGDLPVLIEGEAGTGKAMLARAIHGSSSRSKKPFVMLDCSMMRANDAGARLEAAIDRAKGGTLYLSSIQLLDKTAQSVLVSAVMLTAPSARTPRLLAASRTSLIDAARSGAFREDLFYRLTVTPIRIPPLRERPFDLAVLAERTALRLASESGKDLRGLTEQAITFLSKQEWRGNHPEFEAAIRLAVRRVSSAWLTDVDFDDEMGSDIAQAPRKQDRDIDNAGLTLFDASGALRSFADIEADIIARAQHHCGGSLGKAAKALGLGRSTLYRKIQEKDAVGQPLMGEWMGDAA